MEDLKIHFPSHLPITPLLPDLEAQILQHTVLIVAGETGSGKSTQLPKLLLKIQQQLEQPGLIGHTQPRRLAARTLGHRISSELNQELGQTVGYQVRFEQKMSAQTRIKLMTDGILLQELQGDPFLKRYSHLIIDEAHERSVNIDLLMGNVKTILKKRSNLKVIITSATLNLKSFAEYFNAPVFEIPGRTFPVETRYQPDQTLLGAIQTLLPETAGHILVFLATEKDIRDHTRELQDALGHQVNVLPLYARLSTTEQNAVFTKGGKRKIILATNVAETSLTIPGVTAVIDSGLARLSRYHPKTKIMRLPIEPISKAESNQRAGRAGREQPGICVRLESPEDWQNRPEFRDPEMLRTHMAQVILRQKSMHLRELESLDLIDPPPPSRIRDGYQLLRVLMAITPDQQLTPIGQQMIQFPLDPRWARALIEGLKNGCVLDILIIVTALSVSDLREDIKKDWPSSFKTPGSDFLIFLKIWDLFKDCKSNRQIRHFSEKYHLSFKRLKEWRLLFDEILPSLPKDTFSENAVQSDPSPELIHKTLLTGLLDQIGIKHHKGFYLGTHDLHFNLGFGSILKSKQPEAILTAGILELTSHIAPLAAILNLEWFEDLVSNHPDLKKKYGDPFWSVQDQMVRAPERRSFLGLALPLLQVNYEKIDPIKSREIFIEEALVLQKINSTLPIWQQHLSAIEHLKHLSRQTQDLRVDLTDEEFFSHYDRVLPASIARRQTFENWLRAHPNALDFTEAHLKKFQAQHFCPLDQDHYPDLLRSQGLQFPMVYAPFDPFQNSDRVKVYLPLHALPFLDEIALSWPIKGYLKPCLALLSPLDLPCDPTGYGKTDFQSQLDSTQLKKIARYLITYHIHDPKTSRTWVGQNLKKLKIHLKNEIQEAEQAFLNAHQVQNLPQTKWIWKDFSPLQIPMKEGVFCYHLALKDEGNAVRLSHWAQPADAQKTHQQGVLRLCLLSALSDPHWDRSLKRLPDWNFLSQQALKQGIALKTLFLSRVFSRAMPGRDLPCDEKSFNAYLDFLKQAIFQYADIWDILKSLLSHKSATTHPIPPKGLSFLEKTFSAWTDLPFWTQMPPIYFKRLPLYHEALIRQISKVLTAQAGDPVRKSQAEFERFYTLSLNAWDIQPSAHTALFRCLVEELRISLFAQDLKTLEPISITRLSKWVEQNGA